MTRSYSFDHYTPLKPDASNGPGPKQPKGNNRSKPPKQAGLQVVHYGKQNAQTEELYAVHAMEQQLEELVKRDTRPEAQTSSTDTPAETKAAPPAKADDGNHHPTVSSVLDEAYTGSLEDLRSVAHGLKLAFRAGKDLVLLPLRTARSLVRALVEESWDAMPSRR